MSEMTLEEILGIGMKKKDLSRIVEEIYLIGPTKKKSCYYVLHQSNCIDAMWYIDGKIYECYGVQGDWEETKEVLEELIVEEGWSRKSDLDNPSLHVQNDDALDD